MTDHAEAGSADPAPLFRALRDVEEHARSGRLHLVSARELRQLRFLGGAIADASSDVPGERLGDVLVRHGLLSQADLEGAVEVVLGERKRLGPVLAERGLLDEARIREAIGLHVREVVTAALACAGLKVAFEELPEKEVETDFECPLSPAQLILDASRRVGLEHVTRAIVADGKVLAVTKDERALDRRVTLTPADGFILSQIDGTLHAADLAGVIPLPREEFERSLFGLLSIGLVGFIDPAPPAPRVRREPAPASEAVPPAPTPPAESSLPTAASPSPAQPPAAPSVEAPPARDSATPPAGSPAAVAPGPRSPEELRRCILEAHRGLERTHYEVLGIGQDASETEVRAAYARLMRTFHPDALRGPGLDDVEAQREAVCLRAGEAYDVLRNEEARAAYDNNLKLWRRKVPAPPPAPAAAPPAPPSAAPPAPTSPAPLPSPSLASPPGASSGRVAATTPGSASRPAPPAAAASLEEDEADAQMAAIAAAEELVGDGEFWDAIQKLEPLIPRIQGPRRARARMALAEAYSRNPKWRRRAEEALRLAIEDSPRDAEPRLRLASLYVELGLPARAASLYRAVLEIDPRNAAAREALGGSQEGPAGGMIKKVPRRR